MDKDELIKAVAAKSDQVDADNLIGGITMDVTIEAVQRGPSNEQPLQLALKETPLFYRPSKTYRRALIGCFGDDPVNWVGQRIRLIRNPDTTFGGVKVGGIEVSHASVTAPIVMMLSTKRGKKSAVTIEPIGAIVQKQPDQSALDNMLKAFVSVGYDQAKLEAEFVKPLAEFTSDDLKEARDLLKELKRQQAEAKANSDKPAEEI